MILSQILSRILSSRVYGEHVEPTILKNPFPLFSAGFLVWIFFFSSCASTKHVETIPLETLRHDTLYINKEHYDSIYIDNSHLIDRSKDTVYLKDISIEYRYKLLHDTVRIIQRDSIPYEVRIETVREVPRRRNILDYISYACLGLVIGSVLTRLYHYFR